MIVFIKQVLRIICKAKKAISGASFVMISTFVLGVVGFHYLEGLSWFDSIYFTFVTMATIGYGDITPHTLWGKILVIATSVLGISSFAVVVTSLLQSLVTEKLGVMLGLVTSYFTDHVIVCGWSDTSKAAVEELLASTDKKIVLVDDKLDKNPFEDPRVHFVKGDYRDPSILKKAGIERATDAVVTTGNDSDTILTVLRIKSLKKDIHVAAEVMSGSVRDILKEAGADHVITSSEFGGRLLAVSINQPGTAMLFDDLTSTGAGNDVYEIKAPMEVVGLGFGEVLAKVKEEYNMIVMAIRRGDMTIINPDPSFKVEKGDHLIVISTPEDILKVR